MRTSYTLALFVSLAGCTASPTPVIVATPVPASPVVQQGVSASALAAHLVPPDSEVIIALDPAQLDTGGITSLPLLGARDLIVRVVLPGLDDGVTFVTVTLRSTDGTIFYTMRTPFSPDPAVVEIDEPGAAHPYDVEHPTGTTLLHLDLYVPIAGTDVVRKSRPGTWQVDATVSTSRPFTLSVPVEATMTL